MVGCGVGSMARWLGSPGRRGAPMPPSSPQITAVVCTRNRAGTLHLALDSLAAQTLPRAAYEVLVVDNHSRDDTRGAVARYLEQGPFRYTREERIGLSAARNRGLEEAQAPIVAFLDDDAAACPEWLEILLGAFAVEPTPAAVGGKIIPHWEGKPPVWLPERLAGAYGRLDYGDEAGWFPEGKHPFGGNMAVIREQVRKAGGFDPALGYAGSALVPSEESDLLARLAAAGGRFYYCPRASVEHFVPRSRMKRSWLLRRIYAQGIATARMDLKATPPLPPRVMIGYRVTALRLWELLRLQARRNEPQAVQRMTELAWALGYFRERRLRRRSEGGA